MKLYRALLHLYPASFRAEYAEELCAVHAQRLRDASPALVSIAAVFETLYNAALVHLDILIQDLRYATRTLARAPGFAATAVLVAALGIGATTAAFSITDHVLIRPLPYQNPGRLVRLFEDHSFAGIRFFDVAPANFRDWKQMSRSFENMGAFHTLARNLIGRGEPQRLEGAAVTSDIFPILGIAPELGRYVSADDDRPGAPGTVVLSDALFQAKFGGDPAVLGRKIVLDTQPCAIIGVMPKSFTFPTRDAQFWIPMRFGPDDFQDRTDTYIYPIATLRKNVSLDQAAAEMKTIAAQIERQFPREMSRVGISLEYLHYDINNQARMMLDVLLAASLCVLLVACTNLANLLMARALVRRKELAVRAAMGAGTERLIRQMLTESLGLALLGGILGVALAVVSLPLLTRLVPVNLPIAEVPRLDWRVLAFAAAITFATGVAFGVFPALRVCRGAGNLRSRSAAGGRKEKMRAALVLAEVAGSMVLLVICGLLIRALWRVQATDPGIRPDHVLTLRTPLPQRKAESPVYREHFYNRVLSEVQKTPGVAAAAYTSFIPIAFGGGVWPVNVESHPVPPSERQNASLRFITPGYFSAMGIPLLAGRDVSEGDTMQTRFVAIVSQSFVRRYWPNENPLGRRFNFGNYDRIVAGIAGDVTVRGVERSSEPQVYLPYRQMSKVGSNYTPKDLVVRTAGDPLRLAPALRRIIRQADPEVPIAYQRLMTEVVSAQTGPRRVQLGALGAFAGIAFLLAATGIHGLLSFAVSTRTQEIGVRMALGATRSNILHMILSEGAVLSAIGVALGIALAFAAATAMRSLLAGVNPADLETFSAAIFLCLTMTLSGSLLPALRAIQVDPTTAIRTE